MCVESGGTTSTGSSGTGTGEATGSSGGSGSTGTPTACNPADGQPNLDCMQIDPSQPFCAEAGVCGGCTVLAPADGCMAIDANKPVCNPDDGQCVQCTPTEAGLCGGNKPACNPDSNACEGCFDQSHCPETACDVIARKCFPIDKVLHVRLGLPGQDPCTDKIGQGGSPDAPYCFVSDAIEHARLDESSGWTFKFMKTDFIDAPQPAFDVLETTNPVSYAFIHEPGSMLEPHTRFVTSGTAVTVGKNVTAYFNNFSFIIVNPQSDQASGVFCQGGARVVLDTSYIWGARGPGIRSFDCEVFLRSSVVWDGWTEGVEIADNKLHMVNSYISDNRFFVGKGGGGVSAANSALDIVYSTILNNNNEAMLGGDSIHCVDDKVVGEVRNSVIARKSMGNNPSISLSCAAGGLKVSSSVIDSEEFKLGNTKLAGEDILDFFLLEKSTGAYKVSTVINPDAPSVLHDKAVWQPMDVRIDFDGNSRMAKAGQSDYAGADVYVE